MPRQRSTHCQRGHERTPDNIRLTSGGGRSCLLCERIKSASPESKALKHQWYRRHAESARNTMLKNKYGVDLEWFNETLEAQEGKCANPACRNTPGSGKWKKFQVDHDHKTGRVRELLCGSCNLALGCVGDNSEVLAGLIIYLQTHKEAIWEPSVLELLTELS